MATLSVPREISRAVWTLLGLCLPALIHAAPPRYSTVSKFISSGEQAYLEVIVDGSLYKIYTEHHADYKAMFVFGERDQPQLLELSFNNSSKAIETLILEFRTEKDRVSPGLVVADNELIKSWKSDAEGFADWQTRFSSFPDDVTGRGALTNASFANPTGIEIVDGDKIVFRMSDQFCVCQGYGGAPGFCSDSIIACAYNNLCTALQCIEAGEWSPACHNALEQAKQCIEWMTE